MAPRECTRRRLVALLGTGMASGVAGCFDAFSEPGQETTGTLRPTGEATTATTPTSTTKATTTNETTTATEPTTVETTTPDVTTTPETTTTADGTTTTTTADRPVRTDDPYATNQAGKAAVRVAHMSPGAPEVDITVDGTTVITNLAYGNVSPYIVFEPGTHRVTVSPSSIPPTVYDEELELEPQTYTVVAIGEVSGANHSLEFRQFGDLVDPLSRVKTRVRFVHTVPDTRAMDGTLAGGDITLFDDVRFGKPSRYAHPDAGTYTLDVRRATRSNDGEVIEAFDVDLPGGAVVTAFANGYVSPDDAPVDAPFGLRVVIDAGGPENRFW